MDTRFKVDDWAYAERSTSNDFRRNSQFIPRFQIKEISVQGARTILRPVKGESSGIFSELCTPITVTETKGFNYKKREEDKIFIQDWCKFIKDSDYATEDDAINDFLEQYYE